MDPNAAKKFIIVADDSRLIAKVLSNKLTAAGYEVASVNNGDEALQAIAARKPDMLILDLVMPIKDGFLTLKELRANPATKDVQVIITTELQQAEDIEKVNQLGVLGVFDKANLVDVVEKVSQLLEQN
jgi:CheY-like chemotaxis protein